jgi:predicted pyridoxine 5'-phosphate oxidase superfamily flavin-nucleotide-binding protein
MYGGSAKTILIKRVERLYLPDFRNCRKSQMAWRTSITGDLARFIAERDHFYFGTASAAGAPYIQHRGGPRGFLHVLDETRLGFADFAGNQQHLSLGNLVENPNAFIFLIDYPNRRRVKIRGRAYAVSDNPALTRSLASPDYRALVERAILFDVTGWSDNCASHIFPRYDAALLMPAFERLERRIHDLEARLRALGEDPGPFEMPE